MRVAILSVFLALSGLISSSVASDLDGLYDVGEYSVLDARQAFKVTVGQAQDGEMQIRVAIAPGYYLYRDKIRVYAEGGTVGPLKMPPAQTLDTPGFGAEAVYEGNVVLPLQQLEIPRGGEAVLHVRTQGCHVQAGVCYPPLTQKFKVRHGHILRSPGA